MLVVSTNKNDFEYDIHSLVKAFYPGVKVKVLTPAAESDISSTLGLPDLIINFFDERILLMLYADGECLAAGIDIHQQMSRLEEKNALKQLIYHLLSAHTETVLPWGALTGIRPVKIPATMLARGCSDDEIIKVMQADYLCSSEKSKLALEIAHREREILTAIDYRGGYSLYVSIPFCPSTCHYCSFTSYPIAKWQRYVGEYLTALFRELTVVREVWQGKCPTTIYIGGGTPTTLTAADLERLLAELAMSFDLSKVNEFCVEAGRPDSIDEDKLAVLMRYGVSRISINPQSMNDETLKLIGRGHTALQVREKFHLAREMGFDNINMDLIFGLPGENAADVKITLDAISELQPDSMTVHALAIKRAAKLTESVNENHIEAEIMKMGELTAAAMGMYPYYLYRQKNISGNFENVGYAKPQHYGIYNILMMEEVQAIAAIGAGGVSKRLFSAGDGNVSSGDEYVSSLLPAPLPPKAVRRDNVKEVDLYIARIDEMLERKRELFAR
ncbi:MAG: coproporphyrinogen dehydrogenase HemZ [Lachnospiraceae bacterium]|jgi:oxygen-independent coproporphyrinogen-3 oxidase|nr:coproporphyrinogen dehydrogenase HemZ [Lachnospiraceae bacterium]